MAKPSITKRTTKGAALTYSELDTNFQNLQDATISIDADGNVIVLDLNDSLTLTPGEGISFSVSGNELTITGTAAVTGLTNPLNADLDLGSYKIKDTSGAATISTAGLKIESTSGADAIQIAANGTGLYTIDCQTDKDLTIRTFVSDVVSAKITLDHDTGVNIGTGSVTRAVSISDGALQIASMTTTVRNTITAINGMIIYNTTDSKFQGRAGGSWVDLH